jgi:hypothetical protein
MQEVFIHTLRAQRAQIRTRWEGFLRVEKVSTALANPDTLVFLFDSTLDEVFAGLLQPPAATAAAPAAGAYPKNPLFAYFMACEQALLEALVLAQATSRHLDPKERDADFAHLRQVMLNIARRDIAALEGVVQSKKAIADPKLK